MNALMHRIITSKRLERSFSALAGSYVAIFVLHRPEPADHSSHGISEKLLERCLQYAVEQDFDFLSIDEVLAAALAGKQITRPTLCFTIDDGYADQVTKLVPLLLKYRARPTMFVVTDFIDGQEWAWDAKLAYLVKHSPLESIRIALGKSNRELDLSGVEARILSRRRITAYAKTLNVDALPAFLAEVEAACGINLPTSVPNDYRPAKWSELQACEKEGLRIGSHAQTHNLFNAIDDRQVAAELNYSKKRLGEKLINPSGVFCYPSGTKRDFSRRHEGLVKTANYQGAVSAISQTSYLEQIRSNPYCVNRIGFPDNFDQFVRYASWLEALRSKFPL